MNNQEILVTAEIKNITSTSDEDYIVARLVDTELWYYGTYPTAVRAKEVASELGNGVVLKRI